MYAETKASRTQFSSRLCLYVFCWYNKMGEAVYFIKREMYVAHSCSGSRAQYQNVLGSGWNLMMDAITG